MTPSRKAVSVLQAMQYHVRLSKLVLKSWLQFWKEWSSGNSFRNRLSCPVHFYWWLWGSSCLRARWWSGTQVVEVEADQQPAFCQGQATPLGVCCCQVNKSPTQHPPSWASCLKCRCTSSPVAVTGPVFMPWEISYADFQSDAWSAVSAQTRGDTGAWLGRWGPWRQKDACANGKWFPAVEGWVIQAASLLCAGTGRCLSPAVLAGSGAAMKCCAAHSGICTPL